MILKAIYFSQILSLTTGTDLSGVITGSAGTTNTDNNDTFTATQDTYTTNDVIVGGNGTDTLNITATAAVGRASSVIGVENINVNSSSLFAASYDADGVTATGTTINVANSVNGGSFTVTNLGTGATVGATGVSGALSITTKAATTQTLTVGANTAASQTVTLTGSGTADTATLAAAGTVALTVTGVETVNLSGNGAAATYTVTGTAGQTINMTGAQNVTLQGDGDTFEGSTVTDSTTAGTTTLKLTADTTGGANLSKTGADLIDLAFASGAATYSVKSGQAVKVSTANTGAMTFDINDNTTSNITGSLSLDLGVAVAGTATNGIVLDATASSDNITSLALTNNTANQSFELLAGTAADVTVSGSKNLTLLATSTAKSVNASNLTGVLTVNYENVNDIATVTGGSGDDVFTNATTAIGTQVTINGGAGNDTFTMMSTAKAVIDGGAGIGDKVVLAGTNDATNLTLSNVEIISLTGTGAATFKASQLTGKTYTVTGDAGVADKIIVGGTGKQIDSTTIDLSSLVLDTANVQNTEVTAAGATALADTLGLGSALTITGTAVIDTVNVSGMSGANTISTGAGADVVVGGTGVDTITGGEGADVITGGAGNDVINLTETTAAADRVVFNASGTNGSDTITGFKSTSDKLDVNAMAGTITAGTLISTAGVADSTASRVDFLQVINTDGTAASITTGGTKTLAAADFTATTLTNVAAFIAEKFTGNSSITDADTGIYAINYTAAGSTTTYIYQWDNDTTANVVQAAELSLVGTVTRDATLVNADFVIA